jgi:hypothetical protein
VRVPQTVGLVSPVGLVTIKLSTHDPSTAVTDVTKFVKSNLDRIKGKTRLVCLQVFNSQEQSVILENKI